MPKRNSGPIRRRGPMGDDAPRPEFGEEEVRGDVRFETCFHFGAGIASVVPWLVCPARDHAEGAAGIGPRLRMRMGTFSGSEASGK
jgi:hypothetical protein